MSQAGAGYDLSVVVPTYGGAESLPQLCDRIARVAEQLGASWELLIVDDASPDRTPEIVTRLQAAQPRIGYLRMATNIGQHAATIVGLRMASGRVVVTIDDDLQQPPESIASLLTALDRGAQVAIARFRSSAHPRWRQWGSRLIQRWTQGRGQPLAITSFKAFRQAAAARLVQAVPATGPYYIGVLLQTVVERQDIVNVDVPHHPRPYGRSGYRPLTLAQLALRALRGRLRAPRR